MAEIRPCDEQTFRSINGVGDIKVEKYGAAFISAIQKYCEENRNDAITPVVSATPESGDILEQILQT